MPELLRVYFLNSNIHTCFFFRNYVNIRNEEPDNLGIKIQFGKNYEKTTYGSVSLQPLSEVPTKCIGISALLANRLGLNENEQVLVSYCDVNSVNSLEILPKREEDYVILLSCKSILESHLLNQVRVVTEGQTLPLYVFSNIVIDVEIGKLQSELKYGQLEKFTEITILHPSEKTENLRESASDKYEKHSQNNIIINNINKFLENVSSSNSRNDEETEDEEILKNLHKVDELQHTLEYEVKPNFMLFDIPKKVLDRFIIVSNLESSENTFGPHSIKIFSKVKKVHEDIKAHIHKSDGIFDDQKNEEENYVLSYVIRVKNDSNLFAYCPPYVMKKLKLYVGSKIIIEKDKTNMRLMTVDHTEFHEEASCCFWSSLEDIRRKTKQIVLNNIRYKYQINTLIIGGLGTGKTVFLQDVLNWCSNEFIYCKMINCKSLRGKKLETLTKLWNDYFRDCCQHEPSLLLLDDLHALTYVDEDNEGPYNKLYSNRVVDLITECFKDFQEKFNISIIASAISMAQLSTLILKRGPRLFPNIHKIPELNSTERKVILKSLISCKSKNQAASVDLDKISNSTKGYTVRDLSDLVEKAVFNNLLRDESTDENSTFLNESDFDYALSQTTPLMLKEIKSVENIEKNWEDVGGMSEAKKILTEIFSWPSKYPKLIESCPLRLQRGVLLYGAPGTGKTMLAGALAKKCGLNFISVKGPEVLSKYVGASEEGVRNLFVQAQKNQPSLLFFDEFDSLAPKRGQDSTGVTDRVVNQLLTQLDGVEALSGVWVLAATSRPDMLDPALLRPGRLDKLVYCPLPSQMDRLSILKSLSKNLFKSDDVDLEKVAEKSEGYTGADIQAVLYNAQMLAINEKKDVMEKGIELKVTQKHLLEALSEKQPSLSKFEKLKYDKMYEKFVNSRKGNFDNYSLGQKVTLA